MTIMTNSKWYESDQDSKPRNYVAGITLTLRTVLHIEAGTEDQAEYLAEQQAYEMARELGINGYKIDVDYIKEEN